MSIVESQVCAESAEQWQRDQRDCEHIMQTLCRVPSFAAGLPMLLTHWVEKVYAPFCGKDCSEAAFSIAVALHEHLYLQTDALSGYCFTMPPMGFDVIMIHIAQAATRRVEAEASSSAGTAAGAAAGAGGVPRSWGGEDEELAEVTRLQRCIVESLTHARTSAADTARLEAQALRIAVPFVLGVEIPLTEADVARVQDCWRHSGAMEARKIAAAAAAASRKAAPVRMLTTRALLSARSFKRRIERIAEVAPGLLLRVLAAARLLGPASCDITTTTTAAPGVFGRTGLPAGLSLARHFVQSTDKYVWASSVLTTESCNTASARIECGGSDSCSLSAISGAGF